jgi:hypothetical protein
MLLHGIAKGESTARLSRERDLDRKRRGSLRQQIQTNLYDTLPGSLMSGTAFEADELYQNAGEKKYAASRRGRPAAQARQEAQRQRHLEERPTTNPESDQPHEVRYWVLEHADKPTTHTIVEGNVPPERTILYTDEASNYRGVHAQHASVCQSVRVMGA